MNPVSFTVQSAAIAQALATLIKQSSLYASLNLKLCDVGDLRDVPAPDLDDTQGANSGLDIYLNSVLIEFDDVDTDYAKAIQITGCEGLYHYKLLYFRRQSFVSNLDGSTTIPNPLIAMRLDLDQIHSFLLSNIQPAAISQINGNRLVWLTPTKAGTHPENGTWDRQEYAVSVGYVDIEIKMELVPQ
jgi:hypothetical protein